MTGITESRRVWRIVYDGDLMMDGYHARAISGEYRSRGEVDAAWAIVSDPARLRHAPKPNLRIQSRLVTDWEDEA